MHVVVAPDSFKGSLTAKEVAETIKQAFQLELPEAQVSIVPMADGGEGTLEALLAATNGKKVTTKATGPLGEEIHTCYGVLGDQETAVIEMAQVAGLLLVPEEKQNPMLTTTYGLGELIAAAIEKGLRNFIIGLGGSATNDGGLGMLQALGARFLDQEGKHVEPIGKSLAEITSADFSKIHPKLTECTFKIASDVQNPLCGPEGASQVYGPQKGATEEQVKLLDEGMKNYADVVEKKLQKKLQDVPGAGAAGGLGFGFLVLSAEMESGAKIVAEAANLEAKIKAADWVVTGEGQSDAQTLSGKVPFFVAKMARVHGIRSILISGSLGKGSEKLLKYFVSCHAVVNAPMNLADALANAEPNLHFCARSIARLIKCCSSSK